MKKFLGLILVIAVIMAVVPMALSKNVKPMATESKEELTTFLEKPKVEETEKRETISVFRTNKKKSEKITIHEYICGSVAAEMPLAYEEEALKAQAIACYTNALRLKKVNNNTAKGDITDDSKIHQGYIDKKERQEKWGEDFYIYEEKLENAVKEVENKALYYNDKLCVASFFAISCGKTENAENIWGSKIPYLKSVDSSGDKLSPKCLTTVSYSKKEFTNCVKKLGIEPKNLKTLKGAVKIKNTSKIGTVLEAQIGDKTFTGEEIRRAFSLRSPVFKIEETTDTITFNVSGYGHGVGLSQYGADYLARQGYNYEEILTHYYTGVEIK